MGGYWSCHRSFPCINHRGHLMEICQKKDTIPRGLNTNEGRRGGISRGDMAEKTFFSLRISPPFGEKIITSLIYLFIF